MMASVSKKFIRKFTQATGESKKDPMILALARETWRKDMPVLLAGAVVGLAFTTANKFSSTEPASTEPAIESFGAKLDKYAERYLSAFERYVAILERRNKMLVDHSKKEGGA